MYAPDSVIEYVDHHPEWKQEILVLRDIILATGLTETIKWGVPVYEFNKKNIVGIAAFKGYVGLWFYQGVFLKDPAKRLMNAQDGKTKAMRQMRFVPGEKIEPSIVKAYILEAIENQKAGNEVKPVRTASYEMPFELGSALKSDPLLHRQFDEFTYGKQKEFALFIAEAKQEKTRLARLDKCLNLIRAGIGLNDKYR